MKRNMHTFPTWSKNKYNSAANEKLKLLNENKNKWNTRLKKRKTRRKMNLKIRNDRKVKYV